MVTTDFSALYQPPSKEHIKQLEESFKKYGIRDAVLKSYDGVTISGHLRSAIGTRLKIPFEIKTMPATATEAEMLSEAVLANKNVRQAADPQGTALRLRNECGWSYPRIGENLGIGEATVRRWLDTSGSSNGEPDGSIDKDEPQPAPPARSTGKDNKSYPAQRANKAEVARRRVFALQLWNQGHGIMDLEKSLGIHRTTIKTDLASVGADLEAPRIRGLEKPEPMEWRDKPKPPKSRRVSKTTAPRTTEPPPPAYQTSHVVRDLRRFGVFFEAYKEENYPGILSFNLEEARHHDDKDWETSIVSRLIELQDAASDLLRIMEDEDYRQYRMKGRDHSDPNYGKKRMLRAVKGA